MPDRQPTEIDASIVLNVMGLRELATRGFRSWLLQDYGRPYEVILNLFNDSRPMFDQLLIDINPNCTVVVREHQPPEFFNTSAANNIGLHVSRGKYVIFANADIIYPTPFLGSVYRELNGRDMCFAVATRVNLTVAQTQTLEAADNYTKSHSFDFLAGTERKPEQVVWHSLSPWMLQRQVAFELGGFDPRVIMAEDRDLMERGSHYLRRTGRQSTLISFSDLYGYHQNHKSTGLFDTMWQSKAVIEPRRVAMDADPNCTLDVIDTPLDDLNALLKQLYDTRKPPPLNQYRRDAAGKIRRRFKKVWNALAHGN